MPSPDSTDWGPYGLADIWDMLQYDDFNKFTHVRAWDKMRILCHGMADSLRRASAELAAQWPPEHSPAAAAFKERLDFLALKFTEAGDAAGNNGPILSDVNRGLAITHGNISELVRTWDRTQRDAAARVSIARTALAGASVIPIPPLMGTLPIVIGLSDERVLSISNTQPAKWVVDQAGAPDVATDWRDDLDSQARGVMTAADRNLVEARGQVEVPPVLNPYVRDTEWDPTPVGGGGRSGFGGGFTGGGFTPTPLPPIPPGNPGRPPVLDDPILDGGSPPVPGLPPTGLPGGPPPIHGPLPGGPGPIPWVMTPSGRAIAPGGVIGDPPRSNPLTAGRTPLGGGPVPIGGTPATRPGALGARGAGGFVAPPGGLIGGRPQGRGGTPLSGAAATARRRRQDEDGDWVVPAGVPGVLEPDPEPELHDPGPGVIGIDR